MKTKGLGCSYLPVFVHHGNVYLYIISSTTAGGTTKLYIPKRTEFQRTKGQVSHSFNATMSKSILCHWPNPGSGCHLRAQCQASSGPFNTTVSTPVALGGCLEGGAQPHGWEPKTSRGREPPVGAGGLQHRYTCGPAFHPQQQCWRRGLKRGPAAERLLSTVPHAMAGARVLCTHGMRG